jgi:hypothetical protein
VEGHETFRRVCETTRRSTISEFQDFGSRGVELHGIATPKFMKAEKPKLTSGRVKRLSISGFRGRRGKALDQGIREIMKSDIPK